MRAYQVIARRWRPQSFDEVVGQRHIIETLKKAIKTGKIAHAYLFSGPRGVGKTSVARIFAKALNCSNGPTDTPCLSCSNCVDITRGIFPDVVEMDAASNRGIDEIRELRESVRLTPIKGKYKVYIIDEVHMLTEQAFNALLKTLEEPPHFVVFVFATTEVRKVPNTILSRCMRFDFKPLSLSEAVDILAKICEKESIAFDRAALEIIAKTSGGSLRDAEMLLEQVIAYSEGKITVEKAREALGIIDAFIIDEFIKSILSNSLRDALNIFENDVINRGYDVGSFVSGLLEETKNRLKTSGLSGKIEDAVKYYTLFRSFLRIAEEIRRHPYPEMLFEAEIVRLTTLPPLEDIASLINNLTAGETFADKREEPVVSFDLVSELKSKILEKSPSIEPILDSVEFEVVDGGVKFKKGSMSQVSWELLIERRKEIEEAAGLIGVRVFFDGNSVANGKDEYMEERNKGIRELGRENPKVKRLLEIFPSSSIELVKPKRNNY